MNFEPTDTQRLLGDSATRLAREAFDYQTRRPFFEAEPDGVIDRWDLVAALGVPGALVPETYGGMGGRLTDIAPVLEAFGQAVVFEPVVATAVIGASLIEAAGTDEQRRTWLPRLAEGRLRVSLAAMEPATRYRLDAITTEAIETDGGFALTGRKTLAFGGAGADLFIVPALLRGGIALFLVPRDTPGLAIETYRAIDLSGLVDLGFAGLVVPADALLGTAETGLPLLEQAVDRGTAALCAEAVGAMQALCDMTLAHLRERHAFGRPLGGFQVLQHRIVDMIVATEQARSTALLALGRADSDDPRARAKAVSAAKVQIGRSARFVGEQAMQLHGAMAITLDHGVGYFHKRLAVIERTFGDVEHHLERFAAAAGY